MLCCDHAELLRVIFEATAYYYHIQRFYLDVIWFTMEKPPAGSLYAAYARHSRSSRQSNPKEERNLSHSEPREEYRFPFLNNHAACVCFQASNCSRSPWKQLQQQKRAYPGLASQSSNKMSFLHVVATLSPLSLRIQ